MEEIKTEALATAEDVNPSTVRGLSIWANKEQMGAAYKLCTGISQTEIVPDAYRNKPYACMIALGLANRMNLEPITVMQQSQVVKGNFTWKGSACKGLIESCGKYIDTEYVQVGEYGTDSWGYTLKATKRLNGRDVYGPTVTMQMAKNEGWYQRNEKWKTMPELMLKYRAAAFFSRTECPEVLMSFQTAEEVYDIKGPDKAPETITIEV